MVMKRVEDRVNSDSISIRAALRSVDRGSTSDPAPPAAEGLVPAADRVARVLVVDDEPELAAAICDTLREKGYEATGFAEPAAALDALRADGFDLLLSDLMMPGIDGIEVLRRALRIDPQLVGVIMTGQGSIQAAVEAMRAGAVDFVPKPFRSAQVLPVLDRALGIRRMRVENERLKREVERLEAERVRLLEEANARLSALAATDPLTGLANRRAFDAALAREAALAARGARPLTLALIDVDNFKAFNDTFGHPAGDDALRRLGAVLGKVSRETDVAARVGGEEFALLMPGTDLAGATAAADRVRAALATAPWPFRPVTVSAGVASFVAGTEGADRLIGAADQALYRAKQAGRNRTEAALPDTRTGEDTIALIPDQE